MKHTHLLIGLLAAILLTASCKTSDDDLNPTPEGLISGYLMASRVLDIDSPATRYTETARAYVVKHPGDTMKIAVDSIKLNGAALAVDNSTKVYSSIGRPWLDTTCLWQVWSTTNIATFASNFDRRYPSYTYKMPDTLELAGFGITLPSGADSSSISISGNQRVSGSFKGSGGSFSSAQLTALNAGPALLEVSGVAWRDAAFGGKNFRFMKQTIKRKAVWLK